MRIPEAASGERGDHGRTPLYSFGWKGSFVSPDDVLLYYTTLFNKAIHFVDERHRIVGLLLSGAIFRSSFPTEGRPSG
jgi:hypothetical protein